MALTDLCAYTNMNNLLTQVFIMAFVYTFVKS